MYSMHCEYSMHDKTLEKITNSHSFQAYQNRFFIKRNISSMTNTLTASQTMFGTETNLTTDIMEFLHHKKNTMNNLMTTNLKLG